MKGILILLAATFVVFFGGDIGGGGGHGGSGGGSSVLEVGDQNFTIHQVGREFNEDVAQISARTGQRLDTQTAINIGILDQTIARMASQALFDQAAAAVSNDTGPGHIALATETPGVVIFGNTNPLRLGPYQRPECIVAVNLDKRAAEIKDTLPNHKIQNVTVDMVLQKIELQLAK